MKIGKLTLGKVPSLSGVIVSNLTPAVVSKAVRDGSDFIELRVDTFKDRSPAHILGAIEKSKNTPPIILTIRSKKEGGEVKISDSERLELFKELLPAASAIDIELSSKKILKDVVSLATEQKKAVIISFHDFKKTPKEEELKKTIKEARSAGAGIVKIATLVKNAKDLKVLTSLLLENDDLIVIGLGEGGGSTRVFFPMLGSLITYGSVTAHSAPGQMSISNVKRDLKHFGY
ncbi:MAG: type I 3-dehydroquinate dehydratase [Thermodesulfobacteriota bacterium]